VHAEAPVLVPVFVIEPAAQAAHEDEFVPPAYVPTAHAEHTPSPAAAYVPAEQGWAGVAE
jgi:hypothetical protein